MAERWVALKAGKSVGVLVEEMVEQMELCLDLTWVVVTAENWVEMKVEMTAEK